MPNIGNLIVAGSCVFVALALVAAELVVPSHGILSIFSLVFALAGVVAAYMASPVLGIILGVLVLIATPVVFYWAIRLYPQTPLGKRVMLARPATVNTTIQSEQLAQLAGQQGVAVSTLRPTGSCEFDGRRIDCVSESDLIQPGTPVVVTRVVGTKVIVRPV